MTTLTEPAIKAGKEGYLSFMQSFLAVYTVPNDAEYMTDNVVERDSEDTEHKLHPPSKSGVKSSPDTRSEIEQVLADLSGVTKTDVKVIVESRLTS